MEAGEHTSAPPSIRCPPNPWACPEHPHPQWAVAGTWGVAFSAGGAALSSLPALENIPFELSCHSAPLSPVQHRHRLTTKAGS